MLFQLRLISSFLIKCSKMSSELWKKRGFAFKQSFLALIFLVLSLCGCSETRTPGTASSSPPDPLLQERSAKDAAFKSDEGSPIVRQDRPGFHGLSYYPVNPDLRFSVKLHRYSSPRQIRLGTNTGEIRSALRYGYFEFQVESQDCRLQVYKLEDAPDRGASLFIPFRDSTSGAETYSGGRYIDLKENTSGVYDLDFNRAYNPYCAYNSEFSCPFPPAENTLRVPIRAGEKKYTGRH
jgi:uncharacterized protein (DUF1684 family)